MLAFFRRYQKIIFICITLMIMISFTFFGTTQYIMPNKPKVKKGELLFSVQKRKVYTNFFEQMVHFLETEPSFCADPFKIIDLNPLNDGVISQDFLAPRLLSSVLNSQFSSYFFTKLAKEKEYQLFVHDDFSMVSIWESFAPQLKASFENFSALKEDCSFAELVDVKADLALAHQRMNGEMVKSFLRYFSMKSQEKELSLPHDLSLFGYHNWSEWFGNESVAQIAKVIIYGAEAAKKQGIKVTKEEVAQDLFRKSTYCLKALKERGNISLDEGQFFEFLISRSGIEKENLFQIWEDVLYFRRGMDKELSSVILDADALESFSRKANESITVKGLGMPEGLKFRKEQEWKEFEVYLDAVGSKRNDYLSLPLQQKELDQIAYATPDLCGKHYHFQVKKIEKEQLKAKVAIQELKRWQKENIDRLSTFRITKESDLEKLDAQQAKEIDAFCYGEIIDLHPDWVEEALSKKEPQGMNWFCSLGEKTSCLEGIDHPDSFAKLLERKEKISCITQDNLHFYQIDQIEDKGIELLSYQEAKQEGILKRLCESKRYEPLQKKIEDLLTRYLVQTGYSLPQDKGEFLASHRFIKQLQEAEPKCFDTSFLPVTFYETLDRSHPDFFKVKLLKDGKKEGVVLQNRGFVFLERQEEVTDPSAPFTKLKQLHHFVTLDLRKKFVKKIVEVIGV